MLNTITIQGRIARDLELRTTQTGTPVLTFTVAVERDYVPEGGTRAVDFIDCTAWNKQAEFINKYFQKGSMIIIQGKLQSRKWEDKNGNKRTNWEVQAESIYFGEYIKKEKQGQQAQPTFEELDDEGECPF